MQTNGYTRKTEGVSMLLVSAIFGILTLLDYTTNLLAISIPASNSLGISSSGGTGAYASYTSVYPHLLGPAFAAGIAVFLVIGIVLIARSSRNPA